MFVEKLNQDSGHQALLKYDSRLPISTGSRVQPTPLHVINDNLTIDNYVKGDGNDKE